MSSAMGTRFSCASVKSGSAERARFTEVDVFIASSPHREYFEFSFGETAMMIRFDRLCAMWVVLAPGLLVATSAAQDGEGQRSRRKGGPRGPNFHFMLQQMDKDKDKKVSKAEYSGPDQRFDQMDENKDGFLTKDEFAKKPRRRGSGDDGAPKVGDEAPTFKLKTLNGKSEFDLADDRGKRPVVLFFGSYT